MIRSNRMEEEVRRRFERIEALLAEVAASQAAAEKRMDRADARMDRADARMEKSEARFEKRMKGFEKLVLIGMKELAQMRRAQKELSEKIDILVDRQIRNEDLIKSWIQSMRRGRNGNN